jgi:UDP-N-acetylmuramyl pentapeptide synthase
LQTVAPPPQRGEVLHFAAGFTVINDSYNSNPARFSMVETLLTAAKREAKNRRRRRNARTRANESADSSSKPAKNRRFSELIFSASKAGADLLEGARKMRRIERNAIFYENSE